MSATHRRSLVLVWTIILIGCAAGCASIPTDASFAPLFEQVQARTGRRIALLEPGQPDPWVAQRLQEPLDLEAAIRISLLNHPGLQARYSDLRLAAAEVRKAVQLNNPRLSLGVRDPDEAGASNSIEADLLAPLLDLILRAARRRVAEGELQEVQVALLLQVFELAGQVEQAWYGFLAAEHRLVVARESLEAARVGSLLSERFQQAGNFTPLERAIQEDALGIAEDAMARAEGDCALARGQLNVLLALAPETAWDTGETLRLPPDTLPDRDAVLSQALEDHPSLQLARVRYDRMAYALALERRFRGITDIDVGISYERETDRTRLIGPALELNLPVFNQSQAEIAAAQARLRRAGWNREAVRQRIISEVDAAFTALKAAHRRIAAYRSRILPARTRARDFMQREYGYMLIGVFDVLEARQREFQARESLGDAVSEFWLAAAELRRAAGGRLEMRFGPPLPWDGDQSNHGASHDHSP